MRSSSSQRRGEGRLLLSVGGLVDPWATASTTQTGYDGDHALAAGEVGKVGVPVYSIEDMETLFQEIPLDRMNTSMTINATAAWLLALYIAVAERHGIARDALQGTTQNDIVTDQLRGHPRNAARK